MSKTEHWSPPAGSAPSSAPETSPPTQRSAPSGTASFSSEEESPVTSAPAPQVSAMSQPVPDAAVRVPTGAVGVRALPAETMLKHFRIDKRIAAGGMGEVFLGFDTSLSRPVAVKTIRQELARDQSFLARFVREAVAQANVVHPHVVQVYFVGEERGQWFLAMQIVDGGSLHDGLANGKRLRWQDAAKHMANICDGLVVAERLGIVHRDIKPANILLDREGRALLSDFGLAASKGTVDPPAPGAPAAGSHASTSTQSGSGARKGPSGSQLQLETVTQVGVVMGTPEYVAPEQLKVGPLDARADMYALGATFFHLVSGKPVLQVKTLGEAIDAYAKGFHAPPLKSVAPHAPRALARVIDRCLEPDANKRYASMADLRAALERALPQPEVPASPPLRALVWILDVAPFIALTAATYAKMPALGPLLFFVAGMAAQLGLRKTPGTWLMRLRLRQFSAGIDDGDVSFARGYGRFLVQHGWYVPLTVGFSALYGSSDLDLFLLVGAAWLAVSVLGSLGAFFGKKRALHDLITGTRVLVDVRYR